MNKPTTSIDPIADLTKSRDFWQEEAHSDLADSRHALCIAVGGVAMAACGAVAAFGGESIGLLPFVAGSAGAFDYWKDAKQSQQSALENQTNATIKQLELEQISSTLPSRPHLRLL